MPLDERRRRLSGLRGVITSRDPGDWIDEQLRDIGRKDAAARAIVD